MRNFLLTAIVTLTAGSAAYAQPGGPSPQAVIAQQAEAMKPLAWMNGRWQGPAWSMLPTGKHEITQTERIGPMLDGSIKVMEGKSFEADGRPAAFNAFGVMSYDAATKTYALHSYAQGRAGTFPLEVTPNGYMWAIQAGPVKIRYTAMLEGGTWTETGEMLRDGAQPNKIFEMKLHRVADTDWPLAGQATAPR